MIVTDQQIPSPMTWDMQACGSPSGWDAASTPPPPHRPERLGIEDPRVVMNGFEQLGERHQQQLCAMASDARP